MFTLKPFSNIQEEKLSEVWGQNVGNFIFIPVNSHAFCSCKKSEIPVDGIYAFHLEKG